MIGAGNAALCAALSAREQGASVIALECAPESQRGGNTAFTAGAMRVVYDDVSDLRKLIADLSDEEVLRTDFGSYTMEDFFDDLASTSQYRADPDLVEVLVRRSHDTLHWMTSKGVRFAPIYGRQAFEVDGKFTFWGGLTIEVVGGGPGLVEFLASACEREGVAISYRTRAVGLLTDGAAITGVKVNHRGSLCEISAQSVVLASGGFEANAEWRTRYLGSGWDLARVRGSSFNTGDGLRMALEIGASSAGQWSGCHAVQWDRNAPEFGDLSVGDGFQKHSYPFGILVNKEGKRFLDEGADFRNYTYAKYGQEVLQQPDQVAWQIFDAKVDHLLRDEYRIPEVSKVIADNLEVLASRIEDLDTRTFLHTIKTFNEALDTSVPFDPNVKDGRRTHGLDVDKSNWANKIDIPPFHAYAVGCGITFTFGGLRITPDAAVVNNDGGTIRGLYAAGEIVGGIFYFNYPGGSGLTSGSVFGRIAGRNAAMQAASRS